MWARGHFIINHMLMRKWVVYTHDKRISLILYIFYCCDWKTIHAKHIATSCKKIVSRGRNEWVLSPLRYDSLKFQGKNREESITRTWVAWTTPEEDTFSCFDSKSFPCNNVPYYKRQDACAKSYPHYWPYIFYCGIVWTFIHIENIPPVPTKDDSLAGQL